MNYVKKYKFFSVYKFLLWKVPCLVAKISVCNVVTIYYRQELLIMFHGFIAVLGIHQ